MRVIIDDTGLRDALARMETAIAERREAAEALKAAIHTTGETKALDVWRASRERQHEAEGVVAWEAKFALECGTTAPEE